MRDKSSALSGQGRDSIFTKIRTKMPFCEACGEWFEDIEPGRDLCWKCAPGEIWLLDEPDLFGGYQADSVSDFPPS